MFRHLTAGRGLCATATLAGLAAATLTTAASAHGSITALYKLDEPVGSTTPVHDSVGDNDGTVIGAPARGQSGQFNTAYGFDGSNDGVNLHDDPAVLPTGDFVTTLWFNADSFSKYDRFIGALTDTGSTAHGLGYRLFFNGNKQITFAAERPHDGMRGRVALNSGVIPETSRWYFAAVRYDADGQASLTVLPNMGENATADDIADASGATDDGEGGLIYNAGTQAHLAQSPGGGNLFDGRLDDVAFFDSLQSDQQLADIYNEGVGSVVPEPASLALLGLGGLAMLGRRRRRRA